ncbi:lactonase family protein [soil metagenome]
MPYLMTIFLLLLAPALHAQDNYLYIGSYTTLVDGTPTGSEGIYIYKFNSQTGKLDSLGTTGGTVPNPSFLAVSPNGKYLYAATNSRAPGNGTVSSYYIIDVSGKFALINTQPSGGDNPLYVEVSPDGKNLSVANYGGSSWAVFPLDVAGAIGKRYMYSFNEGKGTHPTRQDKPHPHAAVFSPKDNWLIVSDFGLDELEVYQLLPQPTVLRHTIDTTNGINPGNGPRHITFHPNGKFVYVVEELSGTVATFYFNYDKLTFLDRVPTHTVENPGPFESADIHLSPDGKFLYASNRGQENNLAIFSVDGENGSLTLVGYQSTLGKTPRNFAIDPSGNFLLVGNQSTGNVVVFKRDKTTGLLTDTGSRINVPHVSCLKFLSYEQFK